MIAAIAWGILSAALMAVGFLLGRAAGLRTALRMLERGFPQHGKHVPDIPSCPPVPARRSFKDGHQSGEGGQ